MPPDPRVHVGVAAVVRPPAGARTSQSVLLMLRRGGVGQYSGDGHGTWSVPGGWLDYGESPMDAAERETLEETGVMVLARRELGWACCRSETTDIQVVTLFIECDYLRGQPAVTEPDKCPEVGWRSVAAFADDELFAPLRVWRSQWRHRRDLT